MIERIIRNQFEDIHSRKELNQNDMKNLNIKLRNNIYTYLIDNEFKISKSTLFNLLENVLDEFKEKVSDKNEFLNAIRDGVNEVMSTLKEIKENPKLILYYKAMLYGDFKYETPVYLGSR